MEKTEEQILKDYKLSIHFTHCIICGNELTKKQYANWRKCCCKDCSNKLKRICFRTPEMREKISKATKEGMQKDIVKQNMSKANKEVWQRQGYKEKMSSIHRTSMIELWQNEDFRNSRLTSMSTDTYKENASKAQNERFKNQEERTKIAKSVSKRWEDKEYRRKQQLANTKRYNTKKLRGTFNTSLQADNSKEKLRQAGFTIEEEKLYPGSSTLHCDVYIEQLDTWIEFHYSQYHNKKPYNSSNPEHIEQLKDLQHRFNITPKNSRGINQYYNIIKNWTDYDVKRKQLADTHKLNYLCFYSEQAFNEWLEQLIFYQKGKSNEKQK